MSSRLLILIAAVLPAVALEGQAPSLPPDINPVTLSRLPPVNRNDLDAEGQRIFDARANNTPGPGPGHISIYSPMGGRLYQLVVLITAREIDHQYEWSAHEPAGLRAGLEQSVIDVVKFDKDVTGLAEKDATVIRFFRGLFREHKVSSDLWAKMVEHFGRQGTIDMMALMSSYFTVGMMMNAVDQHLPPERQPLMPTLTRGR